jgi:polysaccharide pyruvyl transferase WcaK-like protein
VKKYHIITVGGYGSNDVGDEAMPRAILINLKEKFEENVKFTMLSPMPEFTEKYHKEQSAADIQFLNEPKNIEDFYRESSLIMEWAENYKKHPILTKFFVKKILKKKKRAPYKKLLKLFKLVESSDALLNVGGGNLNSIMRNELYRKCTLHKIFKMFNKKVFISGQTLGPYYNDNDKVFAREALNQVDVLTFRDKRISYSRALELGLTPKNYDKLPLMYDAGDDALSLPQVEQEKARTLIDSEASKKWNEYKEEYLVGLNLKASLALFKGENRSNDLRAETTLLAQITIYILDKYKSKVIFIPTDYCDGVDDRVIHKQTLTKISEKYYDRITLLENIYEDIELKGIISCCDFVLGSRFHFNVFSLACKVPSIGIASGEYQKTKLDGIFSLLNLREFYIEKDMEFSSIDDVVPVIDKLVAEKQQVKEILEKNVPLLIADSKKIVNIIYNDLVKSD